MTIDEIYNLAKAEIEGKIIQAWTERGWEKAHFTDYHITYLLRSDEFNHKFRIKPEPRELYGVQFSNQNPTLWTADQQHAEHMLEHLNGDWKVVKFREVLDE